MGQSEPQQELQQENQPQELAQNPLDTEAGKEPARKVPDEFMPRKKRVTDLASGRILELGKTEDIKVAKAKLWGNKEREIREIKDIEGGVIKIVTLLNILGFSTSQSCEGHVYYSDKGVKVTRPFIIIVAPNKPERRFLEQDEMIKTFVAKVANKNIPRKILDGIINRTRRDKKWDGVHCPTETIEYQEWRGETIKLMQHMEQLLGEFYEKRDAIDYLKLTENEDGSFCINNSPGYTDPGVWKKKPHAFFDQQSRGLDEKLFQYRKELDDFAEFLKKFYKL